MISIDSPRLSPSFRLMSSVKNFSLRSTTRNCTVGLRAVYMHRDERRPSYTSIEILELKQCSWNGQTFVGADKLLSFL